MERIDISISELEAIVERSQTEPLSEQDCERLRSVLQTLYFLTQELEKKGASKLMLPERIEFIDSIPLTKIGKPDKKALREDIRKRLGMI